MAFEFDSIGYIDNNNSKALNATGDFTLTFPPFQYRDATKVLYSNGVISDAILMRTGSILEIRIDGTAQQVTASSPLNDLDWVEDLQLSRVGTDLTVTFAGTTEVLTGMGGTFNPSRIGGSGIGAATNYDGIINGGALTYDSPDASYDFSAETGTELLQTAPTAGVGNGVLTGFVTGGFIPNIEIGGSIRKVNLPTEFDWFTDDVYEDGSTTFDVTQFKDSGVTKYVDPVNGDDGNDGGIATPWKTLSFARAQTCDLVILAAGDYWDDCPGVNNPIAGTSKSFVCNNGRANIFACSEDDSNNWIPDPTRANVWMWENSPAVFSVWDAGNLTSRNFWGFVQPVNSADEVRDGDVTAGRYGKGYQYRDSTTGTLYVKTQDLRQPDKNVKVNTAQRWNAVQSGKSAYFENINFHFNVLGSTSAGTQGTQRLTFYNFFAGYGSDADNATIGLDSDSTSRFYAVNGVIANSEIDNISYRTAAKGVELNIQSYDAGHGGPNNCSTSHGSSSVLRLNSIYEGADGPVVGDIESTTTFNVNCRSLGGDSSFNCDAATTTCWYLNCDMPSSTGLGINGSGIVYTQGNNNSNGISGSLTVNAVTNLTNGSITKEDDTPPLITVAPPTTYYSVNKSDGGTFSLPIATSKDGKVVTTITPSTNTYVSTENGDFTVIYTSEDSEFNEATPVTLTVSQFGITPSVIEPAINDAIFAKLRSLGYTGSYNDMWSQFWTDPNSLDCP